MPFQKIYIPHPQKGLECPMGVVVVVEGDGGGLGSRPKHLTKCIYGPSLEFPDGLGGFPFCGEGIF